MPRIILRAVSLAGVLVLVELALPPRSVATPPPRWILAYAGGARAKGMCDYTVDDFRRLITVVDSSGQSQGWLMTGVILLQLFAPSGHVFESSLGGTPADGSDWTAYLDSLFAEGGILQRLDSAVGLASVALGPPASPFLVSVMIPYPESRDARLEVLGGTYDLWKPRGRRDLTLAYSADVRWRFEAATLKNLSLDGYYWLHELMPETDKELVADVAHAVHDAKLRLLWIPYYDAEGWDRWRTFGFDEAWLQPNYFFDRGVPATRLDSAVARAEKAGMGLEIEFDWRALHDPQFTDRLGPYVAAVTQNPAIRDGSIAIFDGSGTLAALSKAKALPVAVRYRSLWHALLQ
jgi:hypothetical protein